MKGRPRFFLDYGSGEVMRRGGAAPNALAVFRPVPNPAGGRMYEAAVALLADANSPVCIATVPDRYLRECCKATSETKAIAVHPRLAAYLKRIDVYLNSKAGG